MLGNVSLMGCFFHHPLLGNVSHTLSLSKHIVGNTRLMLSFCIIHSDIVRRRITNVVSVHDTLLGNVSRTLSLCMIHCWETYHLRCHRAQCIASKRIIFVEKRITYVVIVHGAHKQFMWYVYQHYAIGSLTLLCRYMLHDDRKR